MISPPVRIRLCRLLILALGVSLLAGATSTRAQDSSYVPTEEIRPISAPFPMPSPVRPAIPGRAVSITDFGGVEGGKVKNTAAIRSAIQFLSRRGGGTVIVPAGTWLTGPVHLADSINLHLRKGAVLLFSQDPADYLPAVFSRHEDLECYKYSAFIYADRKTNIAITGQGTLNGQGKPWWPFKTEKKHVEELLNDMARRGVPVEQRTFDGREGRELRPAFFQPMRCKNVLVEGVTFLYGAFWTITPTYCENVIVRKVTIVTEGEYGHVYNGDGVDPSSSRNVLIEECEFDTGDDCIAIKAGRDQDGLRVNMPTENVVIRNCRGLRGHGGIVIGSETSGGIRNILAEECQFSGTDRIVRIKTTRGRGGTLENMWFRNLSGSNILMEALHINMLYTGARLPASAVDRTTPRVRMIHFEGITSTGGKDYAIELLGLPEMPLEEITFDRITADGKQGVNIADARGVSIRNASIRAETGPIVRVTESQDVALEALAAAGDAATLVIVKGPSSRGITLRKTSPPASGRNVSLGPGVPRDAISLEK
jgi:polygalacturonase